MRLKRWSPALLLICALVGPRDGHAAAETSVNLFVVKEHGVGTPALAQPYLDKFVAIAAQQNGWPSAKGQYFTTRSAAESFISAQNPHYGILSLGAFLALKDKYLLTVIGQLDVKLAGGRRYFVISRSADGLAGCKGQTLASDHADDPRFIDNVVARGSFKLGDFTVVPTQRPLQTIRKVLSGEATCALIDDAQLSELAHIDGADRLRRVWQSAELPPMVVVAFPHAPTAERTRFRANLPELCDEAGQSVCAEVGITDMRPASEVDYAEVIKAYAQ
jgi:hypothetical protein